MMSPCHSGIIPTVAPPQQRNVSCYIGTDGTKPINTDFIILLLLFNWKKNDGYFKSPPKLLLVWEQWRGGILAQIRSRPMDFTPVSIKIFPMEIESS